GGLVDALVVDAWRDHLDRAGRGQHLPRLRVPVAHDEAATTLVQLLGVRRDVRGDLSLQRRSEHPSRPITHDLVDQRPARHSGRRRIRGCWRELAVGDYGEHGRTFPTRVGARACLIPDSASSGGYASQGHPQVSSIALFTGDGDWAGQELTDDPQAVALCRSAFEAVWSAATPHEDYGPR